MHPSKSRCRSSANIGVLRPLPSPGTEASLQDVVLLSYLGYFYTFEKSVSFPKFFTALHLILLVASFFILIFVFSPIYFPVFQVWIRMKGDQIFFAAIIGFVLSRRGRTPYGLKAWNVLVTTKDNRMSSWWLILTSCQLRLCYFNINIWFLRVFCTRWVGARVSWLPLNLWYEAALSTIGQFSIRNPLSVVAARV